MNTSKDWLGHLFNQVCFIQNIPLPICFKLYGMIRYGTQQQNIVE